MNSLKDSKSFTEAMLISSIIAYVTLGVGFLAFYLYVFKDVDSAAMGAYLLIPISIMFFGFLTLVYCPEIKIPFVKNIDYIIEKILDSIVFIFLLLPMIMFSIPILLINLHIIKKSEKLEKTTKNRK